MQKRLLPFNLFILFLSILVAFSSVTAFAQIKRVNIGDKVGITAPSVSADRITGELLRMTPAQIRVRHEYSRIRWRDIPISSISKFEVKKTVRQTGRGALIGAGIGSLTLGLIAMTGTNTCSEDDWVCFEMGAGELFLGGAAIGALSGAAIGAIVGSTKKKERWKRIPLEITTASFNVHLQERQYVTGIKLKWRL